MLLAHRPLRVDAAANGDNGEEVPSPPIPPPIPAQALEQAMDHESVFIQIDPPEYDGANDPIIWNDGQLPPQSSNTRDITSVQV